MALFATGVLGLDPEAKASAHRALARVLGECGQGHVPDDQAVCEYCDSIIQGFLDDGCIDGKRTAADALYEAVQPFVDPDEEIGCPCFIAAVARVTCAGSTPSEPRDALDPAPPAPTEAQQQAAHCADETPPQALAARNTPACARSAGAVHVSGGAPREAWQAKKTGQATSTASSAHSGDGETATSVGLRYAFGCVVYVRCSGAPRTII